MSDWKKIPKAKPREALPKGWHWVWRVSSKDWAATCGRPGARTGMFWCEGAFCWDTCDSPIPTAVIVAVLKVNLQCA